jgi:alpha-tubulin suppressor-like RCC1 family protein
LFSWGNNLNGQLGLGHEIKTVAAPSLVSFFKNTRLKKIDCSQESSLVLTQSGKVYSFGSARSGNLGHDFDISGKNESLPELIAGLEDEIVEDISISDYHGAALNDKGELFAWGTLTHGKLGIQKEDLQVKARRERVSNSNVLKEPLRSEYFGSSSGLINAKKVHCSFQSTFIIGNSN